MLHRGKASHPVGQKSQSLGDKFSSMGDICVHCTKHSYYMQTGSEVTVTAAASLPAFRNCLKTGLFWHCYIHVVMLHHCKHFKHSLLSRVGMPMHPECELLRQTRPPVCPSHYQGSHYVAHPKFGNFSNPEDIFPDCFWTRQHIQQALIIEHFNVVWHCMESRWYQFLHHFINNNCK